MTLHHRINRFLAEWVSAINALVAVGIPVLAAIAGASMAGNSFGRFSLMGFIGGLVGGGLVGVLLAGSACGVLAVLIDIRNSLESQGRSVGGRDETE